MAKILSIKQVSNSIDTGKKKLTIKIIFCLITMSEKSSNLKE